MDFSSWLGSVGVPSFKGAVESYFVPTLLVSFLVWRWFQSRRIRLQLPGLMQEGATIVDVRSRGEFASGAHPKSINLPLNDLERGLSQLTPPLDPEKPVIVCCASGTRSAMAASLLRQKGFKKVVNGGSWMSVVI
jgi:phage shock protein E